MRGRVGPRRGSLATVGDRRLAALRIAICGYATVWTAVRSSHLIDTTDFEARRLDPVGPLAWIDQPLPASLVVIAVILTPVVGLAATLGWKYRATAPLLALGFLFLTTYRNSWGQIFHTENLTSLHLIVLAIAPADRHWALRRRAPARSGGGHGAWAVQAMVVMTVCTYFVAGVAKLRIGGWAWVDGDVLLHQVSFDNARKDILGDRSSPFASLLVAQAWLTGPAAVASMVVELGAPLALFSDRLARWWCAAAWLFHVAILALMAILFPYHLLGIALAPLLPVERGVERGAAWAGRRRLRGRSAQAIPSTQTSPRGVM
jgi:hypothetical protein